MRQHYVLTLDPRCREVFAWIELHGLDYEVHLNRTRFWIADGTKLYTEFLLRFSECCPSVDDDVDQLTGLPLVGVIASGPVQ